MLRQLPPSGVYSGMAPWANRQGTKPGVGWPASLSRARRARNGGGAAGRVLGGVSLAGHAAQAARFASGARGGAGGGAARIAAGAPCRHGCGIAFVPLVTPLTRT